LPSTISARTERDISRSRSKTGTAISSSGCAETIEHVEQAEHVEGFRSPFASVQNALEQDAIGRIAAQPFAPSFRRVASRSACPPTIAMTWRVHSIWRIGARGPRTQSACSSSPASARLAKSWRRFPPPEPSSNRVVRLSLSRRFRCGPGPFWNRYIGPKRRDGLASAVAMIAAAVTVPVTVRKVWLAGFIGILFDYLRISFRLRRKLSGRSSRRLEIHMLLDGLSRLFGERG
jgi:hypothetical protein